MPLMKAPKTGVCVRMYRHGHGDCFLLAFPQADGRRKRPVYMLIDCGLKKNSEIMPENTIDKVIEHIAASTGNRIDIVVITHEHEDHVSGFAEGSEKVAYKKRTGGLFSKIKIGQAWFAWTEDPNDPDANTLRSQFEDTLVALVGARRKLLNRGADEKRLTAVSNMLVRQLGDEESIDRFENNLKSIARVAPHLPSRDRVSMAMTGDDMHLSAAPKKKKTKTKDVDEPKISGITNKTAMKLVRDAAEEIIYLSPGDGPVDVPHTEGVRIFPMGPPRNTAYLKSSNPHKSKDEDFEIVEDQPFALDGSERAFSQAASRDLAHAIAGGTGVSGNASPFAKRYCIGEEEVWGAQPYDGESEGENTEALEDIRTRNARHFRTFYGGAPATKESGESRDDSHWRRIDDDWLAGADTLALRMGSKVNNTSLVMAIELKATGKVLLFTGDAQRGSWVSWKHLAWSVDDATINAKDLLGRTVLYKVGHHGSHNATLAGTLDSTHPNLSWMAQGDYADEFVAMIPANTKWATQPYPDWKHPWPSIEKALHEKARGRIFQTDVLPTKKPDGVPVSSWTFFDNNKTETDMYFEYTIHDEA